MLRELNQNEMEKASGGIGPVGFLAGVAGGAVFELVTNPDATLFSVVGSAVVGGVTVGTGGFFLAGTTASRVGRLNGLRNVGIHDDIIELGGGAATGAISGGVANAIDSVGSFFGGLGIPNGGFSSFGFGGFGFGGGGGGGGRSYEVIITDVH